VETEKFILILLHPALTYCSTLHPILVKIANLQKSMDLLRAKVGQDKVAIAVNSTILFLEQVVRISFPSCGIMLKWRMRKCPVPLS
jgi:hypothetical protein